MNFEELIAPLTVEEFVNEYKGKKPFVSKGNNKRKKYFSDIISWKKFSEYLSNDRAVSGLQAIVPGETMAVKMCMEKTEDNYLKPKNRPLVWRRNDYWYDPKRLHSLWYNNNASIILTKASKLTPNINSICCDFEKGYSEIEQNSCAADAHFYCSHSSDSKSFECHADQLDNFLIHSIGRVHWKVYSLFTDGKKSRLTDEEESKYTPFIDEILSEGDVLYIPKGLFHRAYAVGPRISISVQVASKAEPIDRTWYDFTPRFD
jgi:ribosomal protein L16 Arg81 hydroxylase